MEHFWHQQQQETKIYTEIWVCVLCTDIHTLFNDISASRRSTLNCPYCAQLIRLSFFTYSSTVCAHLYIIKMTVSNVDVKLRLKIETESRKTVKKKKKKKKERI